LGYSHAADLLNPISDLRLLGLVDIELNQDLSALYVNTSLSDIEAVDSNSSTVSTNKKPHPWLIFITVLPKLHLKAIVFTKS
jgi:hypothetical protein